MIDWSSCKAVERHPDLVSGAWVFFGTRVPVAALFENLEDGVQVQQFVAWFPGVTLEQTRAVLEHAARSALADSSWPRVRQAAEQVQVAVHGCVQAAFVELVIP